MNATGAKRFLKGGAKFAVVIVQNVALGSQRAVYVIDRSTRHLDHPFFCRMFVYAGYRDGATTASGWLEFSANAGFIWTKMAGPKEISCLFSVD